MYVTLFVAQHGCYIPRILSFDMILEQMIFNTPLDITASKEGNAYIVGTQNRTFFFLLQKCGKQLAHSGVTEKVTEHIMR